MSRTPIQIIPCDKGAVGKSRERVIRLRREGAAGGGDLFRIRGTVGEGGSCVCYEAVLLGEGKTGRLKEFYPLESAGSLERTAGNHVVSAPESAEAFAAECDALLSAYRLLRATMEKKPDLTGFIPDFSIYYACDEAGEPIKASTVYIWTAFESMAVFDEVIADIRRHPTVRPELKLLTVLETVITLTECVKVLHENNLLHLDIKPGNFGIPRRGDRLLTDSVTLFDINTVRTMDDCRPIEYGSAGFSAPELRAGSADGRSDIYSIGRTLLSAITPIGEGESVRSIDALLDASPLLRASEITADVYLRSKLRDILQKSLDTVLRRRYSSCVDLIRDLKEARACLYPAKLNPDLPADKRLRLLEKEGDRRRGTDLSLTFLYHLYRKPLYECMPEDHPSVDILIVGFGNYGQRFLDCCLQVGQIRGKSLNIKIVSNDNTRGLRNKRDLEIYLESRPALADFFAVAGSSSPDDPYGSIVFEKQEFHRTNAAENRRIAKRLADENHESRYVFIALGDDALNKSVAKAFVEERPDCSVSFAYGGEPIKSKTYGTPVYTAADIAAEPLYRELERRAFNAHLVWENGLNIDMAASHAKFKEPYNYRSSFANVISIKYKLHSLGIETDDPAAAAAEFSRLLSKNNGNTTRNVMAAQEHRRWICEKLCEGWVCQSDLEACLTVPPNDKKNRRHVCLVRSNDGPPPLLTVQWQPAAWDTATEEKLATLDELDRVSVRLHQIYQQEADRVKREHPLLDPGMLALRCLAGRDARAGIAFSEWYHCLSLLWDGKGKTLREYAPLTKELTEALSGLGTDADEAKRLLSIIDSRVAILLKSMQYLDYKNNDLELVSRIPFILTYRRDIRLAIPLGGGSNTAMFGNVAAATVVNPKRVTYLCHADKTDDLLSIREAIGHAVKYMEEKQISSEICLVLTYIRRPAIAREAEAFREELARVKRIKWVLLRETESKFTLSRTYTELFDAHDTKLRFDAIENNQTNLASLLIGAGIYASYPNYSFDINTRRFWTCGCDYLRYIKAEQYLKVSDMFAAGNSKGRRSSVSAFSRDYRELWGLYRGGEAVWKRMCDLLAGYHKQTDNVFNIQPAQFPPESIAATRFLLPAYAYEGARKIVTVLTEAGLLTADSDVRYYTSDSCEVDIRSAAKSKLVVSLRRLFADPYMLSRPELIAAVRTPNLVSISFDRLTVQSLPLPEERAQEILALLHTLEDRFAFISGLTESGGEEPTVSFSYATPGIKRLLTNAGHILEIYIYHKCLESGLYDDVAMGYEVNWDNTAVMNEFDIIVTKGFASLIIEAKAREDLDQSFYFKLSSLARRFGINCKPVLVADTLERDDRDHTNNDTQRLRGDMMDVITISKKKEIGDIANTLKVLFKQ